MTTEYREREREMSIEKRAEGGGDTERDVKNERETQQPERLVEPDKTERERKGKTRDEGRRQTEKIWMFRQKKKEWESRRRERLK